MKNAHNYINSKQCHQNSCNHILQVSWTFCSFYVCQGYVDDKQIGGRHLWNKRKDIVDEISKPQRKQTARHCIAQPKAPTADKSDNIIACSFFYVYVTASCLGHNCYQLGKRQSCKHSRNSCQKYSQGSSWACSLVAGACQNKNSRTNHCANTNH